MSTQQNKEIVTHLLYDVINKRNYSLLDQYISPDFANSGTPNLKHGAAAFREVIDHFLEGFPDLTITVQNIIAEGDLVATRGYFTGKHQGPFMGYRPSGRLVQVPYMDFWKIKDGLCTENWVQMDFASLLVMIGAISAPSPQFS